MEENSFFYFLLYFSAVRERVNKRSFTKALKQAKVKHLCRVELYGLSIVYNQVKLVSGYFDAT